MSTVCSVLVGSGRKPIMFENQIQKKRAPRKGNQRAAVFAVEVAAGDVVLGQVVGDLDRGLDPVRLLRHPPRDPGHRAIVRALARTR